MTLAPPPHPPQKKKNLRHHAILFSKYPLFQGLNHTCITSEKYEKLNISGCLSLYHASEFIAPLSGSLEQRNQLMCAVLHQSLEYFKYPQNNLYLNHSTKKHAKFSNPPPPPPHQKKIL